MPTLDSPYTEDIGLRIVNVHRVRKSLYTLSMHNCNMFRYHIEYCQMLIDNQSPGMPRDLAPAQPTGSADDEV